MCTINCFQFLSGSCCHGYCSCSLCDPGRSFVRSVAYLHSRQACFASLLKGTLESINHSQVHSKEVTDYHEMYIPVVTVQMTWYPKYSSPTVNQAQTGHTPIWTLQLCVLLFLPFIKHSFKPAFKAALFNNQPIWIPTPLNLQNLLTLRLWDSTVQE